MKKPIKKVKRTVRKPRAEQRFCVIAATVPCRLNGGGGLRAMRSWFAQQGLAESHAKNFLMKRSDPNAELYVVQVVSTVRKPLPLMEVIAGPNIHKLPIGDKS